MDGLIIVCQIHVMAEGRVQTCGHTRPVTAEVHSGVQHAAEVHVYVCVVPFYTFNKIFHMIHSVCCVQNVIKFLLLLINFNTLAWHYGHIAVIIMLL